MFCLLLESPIVIEGFPTRIVASFPTISAAMHFANAHLPDDAHVTIETIVTLPHDVTANLRRASVHA